MAPQKRGDVIVEEIAGQLRHIAVPGRYVEAEEVGMHLALSSRVHFSGMTAGTSLFLSRTTTNLARSVVLALRLTR